MHERWRSGLALGPEPMTQCIKFLAEMRLQDENRVAQDCKRISICGVVRKSLFD
jgi:hypothetical protein